MKTITLKADEDFDARLTRLAERLGATKSSVIREAVGNYERQVEREELARRIREASLKTREEALRTATDWDDANADGL
ncbi:MAG: ribbon-helix-helix protein, CopG family [Lysobacterales bacterium]|jgi:predicted transcriptional regulator|nr:MAG: ribbon-helix-helix protein, CopG family [Xanthomonadales bacterium]